MTTPTLHHELTFLRAQNARLKDEISDLKTSVIAFGATWIIQYAENMGLDGLHPEHYDILKSCGARMDSFKRAELPDTTRGFMADEPKNWSEG